MRLKSFYLFIVLCAASFLWIGSASVAATKPQANSKPIHITFEHGLYAEHSLVPVFQDKANLYTSASESSAVLEQLSAGQIVETMSAFEEINGKVKFVDNLRSNTNAPSMTVNEYSDYWYAIKVKNSGKLGFIWGGALAKAAVLLSANGSRMIVFGLFGKGKEAYGEKQGEAKLIDGGKVISQVLFAPIETKMEANAQHFFYYTVSANLLPSQGFSSNLQLMRINFVYEACDYECGDVLVVLYNNKLSYLLSAIGMSNEEAWVGCKYILPSNKHGVRDRITVFDTTTRVDFIGNKPKEKLLSQYKKVYLWNGSTFTKISDTTPKDEQ